MPHALIVDDDRSNLGVLQELLTLEGFTYTSVQDSTQVEAVIAEMESVDIVLLDLEMPDRNGYEIFRSLREHPRMVNVPIVACTIYSNEILNVRDLGFEGFISKPLDADRFGEQLAALMNGEGVWDAY